ncbi:MAG: class I SAM-dependent methyltransferase [Phycisphaerales bacterium]|nr:MAG: class I SAM-dependent methyltransferase [Phycisphaerales bacterium]
MRRVLEPEIMDDESQAVAYARADFSSSNQAFVDGLIEDYGSRLRNVLDIGCGPADVPIRLARAIPSVRITAADASDAMAQLARKAVDDAGLQQRMRIVKARIPGLRLEDERYDAVISKDLLHHLPDPAVFWQEIKTLAKDETVVYVMDLFRPPTKEAANKIVESVAPDESPMLKRDFYNSLLAAFTLDEIREQLDDAGLRLTAAKVSERHVLAKGLVKNAR